MKKLLKLMLYGFSAGLVAALVWAGFSYATGAELGWIAWGVGLLVGLAVRIANVDIDGWAPGMLAVVIAILSILCGKYLTVRFIMADEFAGIEKALEPLAPEVAKVDLANEVVSEYEAQKKKIIWPEKTRLLTSATKGPQMESEFPPYIWKEMNRRWYKLTADDKGRRITLAKKKLEATIDTNKSRALEQGFEKSFSLFDILWILLATATAFRVGSGVVTEDH